MPGIAEIKTHIKSVQKTQKITNAMYLIASTKVQKARRELDKTRPYFNIIRQEISRIFLANTELENPFVFRDGKKRQGDYPIDTKEICLVITADKGLAGMYNDNILKQMSHLLDVHPGMDLFLIGAKGRSYCDTHGIPYVKEFKAPSDRPTLENAHYIMDIIKSHFEGVERPKLYVIYTDMDRLSRMNVKTEKILPFEKTDFDDNMLSTEYEYFPSLNDILDNLIHVYLGGYLYGVLVDAYCSEQMSRMEAMNAANENAEDLLSQLNKEYNVARQDAITQELTEISAGALAMRKAHERK